MCPGAPPALIVWYDGNCALCRGARSWLAERDRGEKLAFRDFRREDPASLPVPIDRLEGELAVRDADGRVDTGYAGVCRILAHLPRWRRLAPWLARPPLAAIGARAYRAVARRRGGTSRPGSCEDSARPAGGG